MDSDGAAPLRYVISADAVDCPLADGLAVFDSRASSYFSLNRTAALIWNGARVPASRAALYDILLGTFSRTAAPDDLAEDLDRIIADFVEAGLFVAVCADHSAVAQR